MARPTASLPYHLRAARLRWSSLAIDLSEEEAITLTLMVEDPSQPVKIRTRAQLLLGLHQRVPIHDLCEDLHMDRRTLYRLATELSKPKARRELTACAGL